ncbi:MAG: formyltransferase family protein, partial [Monoglobales bacterium]
MIKARIAVLVSGGGTNLQALIDAEKKGIIKSGEISLVISGNPDAYALTRAKNAGIGTFVIPSADTQFEDKLIAKLEEE